MSNNPLDFFERSIRPIEESSGPIPDLQIDKLLGFSDSEGDRLYSALTDRYPAGHWALDQLRFRYSTEKAMQLLSAGLCMLGNKRFEDGHPLECCARIVNAPTLSPYIRKRKFNYVIVSAGFISAIEKFVSSTCAIATIAASQKDPNKDTVLWDQDFFLGSISILADTDIFTFTRGVMEASSEGWMQQVVEDSSDMLTFLAFDRKMHSKLMGMMPEASNWKRLGYRNLDEALTRYPEIRKNAEKIARLSVCFAVCHEFGHAFTLSIGAEGAQELGSDENFTDMTGSLILYRLIEAGVLPIIVGSEVTVRDLGHALAAFHSWNLSKELCGLLRKQEDIEIDAALARLQEVAMRWDNAMILIKKVWIEDVPALAHLRDKVSIGLMIVNHWGVMTAGMLRVALLVRDNTTDIETACKLLPLLSNRESKLYSLMTG
ncbi:MAG TPA: hypothetical protein VIH87_08675 [Methylocella sp.]